MSLAAKKEGTLTPYTTFAEKDIAPPIGPFEKKHGIKVKSEEPGLVRETVLGMGGEEKGLRFWRELVARNGTSVRQGHTLLTNMDVSGEVPLALAVYDYMPEAASARLLDFLAGTHR